MVSPTIQSISPFDARYSYSVNFVTLNTNAYASEIIIRQANNLSEVFNYTIGTGTQPIANTFSIPANTMRNGLRYGVRIRCQGQGGEWSSWSSEMFFYCFSKAELSFTNIPSDKVIRDSVFGARVMYNQNEGEELQSYTFYLYDANKVLLSSSDMTYTTYDIRHQYTGLENGSSYYVRVTGVTIHNMFCDSGYHSITANYTKPSTYSILYLTNHPSEGYITARTNINLISPDDENELYYYHDGWIDLITKPLVYPDGFELSDDFTMWVKIKDCYKNLNPFVKLENPSGGCIYLSSFILPTGEIYYRLTATHSDGSIITPFDYVIYSNTLPALKSSDEVTICVRREHNIFDIKVWLNDQAPAFNIGKVWIGANSPVNGVNNVQNGEAYVNIGTNTDYIDENKYFYSVNEPENVDDNSIWIGGE